jgi:hypothetical protein
VDSEHERDGEVDEPCAEEAAESASPNIPDRVAAESWFLSRGLPSVLTRRARWRRLWRRSAPMLAGVATLVVGAAVVTAAAGPTIIDIDDSPTATEWLILVVLALIVPAAFLAGWLVSRITDPRRRQAASTIAVGAMSATALLGGSVADGLNTVVTVGGLVLAIMVLNGLGVGSVLGWATRLTVTHLASVGALAARALPVVLLTVLVFFNTYVWSMATRLSRDRMWLIVGFMTLLAVAFLVTGVVERVRPMLASRTVQEADADRLADTPFATMADPSSDDPLSHRERLNVVFVVAASQIIQIAMVAVVTAAIFFVLGLLVLSPELLPAWTGNGPDQGVLFGMILPIPQPLIHVTMFLGALTFMYVSARAVGDGEYRKLFLDPLVDDLRLTLVARSRYRAHVDSH